MALAVDNPIINEPFSEPAQHYAYEGGGPVMKAQRRAAGYYFRPRTRMVMGAVAEEQFVPLETVNEIRRRVGQWRENDYPGVTGITRQLLRYWTRDSRERRLFFCQREAVETMIWLVESPQAARAGIDIPPDDALRRFCCKMATGSGKTIVMAMVAAWSVLNKVQNRQDTRFSDSVLILCPNLTVKQRIGVLIPSRDDNYYQAFDIVPGSLMEALNRGKFLVTNWHALAEDRDPARSVVQRGKESDEAFARRVLGRDLGPKKNILVLNDEAHHAYREAPAKPDAEAEQLELPKLTAAEKKQAEDERQEARVWVQGLDKINRARGINFCFDVSATPFYIAGSGYDEGLPLPWITSDFGLVDAIECGIVKIPRVPVDDDSGNPVPKYFRLWDTIMAALPASEREGPRRKAKPEAVSRQAEGAAITLAGEWHETFEAFVNAGSVVPPAMIVVCDNTDLAKEIHAMISRSGLGFEELKNTDNREQTIRIDTKLLAEAESREDGQTKQDLAEQVRERVSTVGKIGQPGEQVRCVVSVSMLTEGWDASNVTQILGLRPFRSQLLCEQVVGRGLRRTNYDDFSEPEYVDVYGIPFEVIPVKKTSARGGAPPKPSSLVQALKEREQFEIRFPRVEGYVFDVKERIRADIDAMPELVVDPSREPTSVLVKAGVGYRVGRPDRGGPGPEEYQDRNPFYERQRLQATVFEIARRITDTLTANGKADNRAQIFPQVASLAWQYIERRVYFKDTPPEEVALKKYADVIVERLFDAIEPDTDAGEAPLLPRIERYRPEGSSREVMFRTTRNVKETKISHVSHIVLDSKWESSVAYRFEQLAPFVEAYVRNDHLDFTVPYEFEGKSHDFIPDYIVRIVRADGSKLNVVVETKGYEREQDRAKESALGRWVRAVNYHGGFGHWALIWSTDPATISGELQKLR